MSYTKLPNLILAHMPLMGVAELKIVLAVARETIGWQKDQEAISYAKFMKLTGLSRPSVLSGLKSSMKRAREQGIGIEREPRGQQFLYRLLVKELDQSTSFTSKAPSPEPVKELDHTGKAIEPASVKEINRREGSTSSEANYLSSPKETSKKASEEKRNKGGAKNALPHSTSAPAVFVISDELRTWADKTFPGLPLDQETERFLDYHRARGNAFRSWPAAWRNWIRRSAQFQEERNEKSVRDGRFESSSQRQERILAERNYDELVAHTIAARRHE